MNKINSRARALRRNTPERDSSEQRFASVHASGVGDLTAVHGGMQCENQKAFPDGADERFASGRAVLAWFVEILFGHLVENTQRLRADFVEFLPHFIPGKKAVCIGRRFAVAAEHLLPTNQRILVSQYHMVDDVRFGVSQMSKNPKRMVAPFDVGCVSGASFMSSIRPSVKFLLVSRLMRM